LSALQRFLAGIALLLLLCGFAEVVHLSPRPPAARKPARVVQAPATPPTAAAAAAAAAVPPPYAPPYALRSSGAAVGTSDVVRFFDEPARSYSPLRVRHSARTGGGGGLRTGLLQMPRTMNDT
jgi:hypothetical protein